MDQRNDKRFRITSRDDIRRVFAVGKRTGDGLITLFGQANNANASRCRAAVTVSKRHGTAVRRNRIKRLCREAFRLTRTELSPGWDFIIVPRCECDFTLTRLRESIQKLAGRLTQQAAIENQDG